VLPLLPPQPATTTRASNGKQGAAHGGRIDPTPRPRGARACPGALVPWCPGAPPAARARAALVRLVPLDLTGIRAGVDLLPGPALVPLVGLVPLVQAPPGARPTSYRVCSRSSWSC